MSLSLSFSSSLPPSNYVQNNNKAKEEKKILKRTLFFSRLFVIIVARFIYIINTLDLCSGSIKKIFPKEGKEFF